MVHLRDLLLGPVRSPEIAGMLHTLCYGFGQSCWLTHKDHTQGSSHFFPFYAHLLIKESTGVTASALSIQLQEGPLNLCLGTEMGGTSLPLATVVP